MKILKVKLVGKNNINGDIIEEVLRNRGFSDSKMEMFLNPSSDNEEDSYLLDNMEEGIKMFMKHIKNNSTILLYHDP